MFAGNHIEDLVQDGNRSLEKMFQGPVPDTYWARSLSEIETSDGSVNLVRVG